RGTDRATLTEREITSKVKVPTVEEVVAWYQANPTRVQAAPLEKVRTPIRELLLAERTRAARQEFLDTLRRNTDVTVSLDSPRERVADAVRPSRGPAGAKVEIIEFSDFQCPFCLRAHPV